MLASLQNLPHKMGEGSMRQRKEVERRVTRAILTAMIAGVVVLASACTSYRIIPNGPSSYEVRLPPKSCSTCGPDPRAMELATNFCAEQREDFGLIPIDMINSAGESAPFMFQCVGRR
jgi:hypothetical protein